MPIRWSNLWAGNEAATVMLRVGTKTVVNKQTGSGEYVWTAEQPGTYELTLFTYVGGKLAGTRLPAEFSVVVPTATAAGVPFAWLEEQGVVDLSEATPADCEEMAASDLDGDGWTAGEEYIIGTDPWEPESSGFTVEIRMDADGKPVVKWSPDLNEGGTLQERVYTVLEADSPAGSWTEAEVGVDSDAGRVMFRAAGGAGNGAKAKFYKVRVQLP